MTFKSLKIEEIHVAEDKIVHDDENVLALSSSIQATGLLHPITVRRTPAGEKPFTLVAGARRIKAASLAGFDHIECLIVKADKTKAQIIEIEKNLCAEEKPVLDKALMIENYREIWEAEHGEIKPGRPQKSENSQEIENKEEKNRVNITQFFLSSFSKTYENASGKSKETLKILNRISKNIPSALRDALRHDDAANNQSLLLKISKIAPEDKQRLLDLMRSGKTALEAMAEMFPKPKLDEQEKFAGRLEISWMKANAKTKRKFLNYLGVPEDLHAKILRVQGQKDKK